MTAETHLFDAVERLFRDRFDRETVRRGSRGEWLGDCWAAIAALGLPQALIPEDRGGFGIETAAAADLLRLVGEWAVPLPLSEMMLAGTLLARAGLRPPDGVLTLAPPRRTEATLTRHGGGWSVEGRASRVPWGRDATSVALVAEAGGVPHILVVPIAACRIVEESNLAGEPRDAIAFRISLPAGAVAPIDLDPLAVHAAGAALRTVMLAGAAQRLLDMAVDFAREHHQFGRPIAKFQAIQQNLAILAGQTAVCRAAGDLAALALLAPDGIVAIAMAKARAGEAAAQAAHLAHQVHGAIAFTEEYDVQLYSRRIWAWRDEFGNEAEWNALVGAAAAAEPDGAWALITRHGRIG